jgi:hypothetical protein
MFSRMHSFASKLARASTPPSVVSMSWGWPSNQMCLFEQVIKKKVHIFFVDFETKNKIRVLAGVCSTSCTSIEQTRSSPK